MRMLKWFSRKRPKQTDASEELVYEFLDSASCAFLITMQKRLPHWFKTHGKWSLTDTTDPIRWRCQNMVPLFEVRAYLLFVASGALNVAKQTREAQDAMVNHCALRITEQLLQVSCPDAAEIKRVDAIISNRAHRYREYARNSPAVAFFLPSLRSYSILWNQIQASIGTTTACADFLPRIINDAMLDFSGKLPMLEELRQLVTDFAVRLRKAMDGCNDYRLKGGDEIRRRLSASSGERLRQ